ncbi:MAG: hypothetical protein Q9210_001841 [Variospora velana]
MVVKRAHPKQERLLRQTKKKYVPDHPPPSAPKPKTGSGKRLACDKCRERKVRCNREQPVCGRCARLGQNCQYTTPAKQYSDLSPLLLTLHSRLEQTEARLALNAPILDPNQGLSVDPTSNNVDFSSFDIMDMQQQQQPSSQLPSSQPTFKILYGPLRKYAVYTRLIVHSHCAYFDVVHYAVPILNQDKSESNTTGHGYSFWEHHNEIDKDLKNCTDAVIGKMDAQALLDDDFALGLDMNSRAIDIFLHEAAIFRAGKDGLPDLLITESNSRCSQAAMRIVDGVSLSQMLAEPKKALFKVKNIFAMWTVCMAMQVLDRQLSATNDNAELGHTVGMLRTLVAAIEDLEDVSGHWIASISHILKRLEDIDSNSMRTSKGEA